jgi:hypothetical protein
MKNRSQTARETRQGKLQLLQQLRQAIPDAGVDELVPLLQLEQVRVVEKKQQQKRESDPEISGRDLPQPHTAAPGRPDYPPAKKEVLFLYLHGLEYREQEKTSQPIPGAYLNAEPFTDTGFSRPGNEIDPKPLCPWQEIWPILHTLLSRSNKTRRLDEQKIIRKVVKQQPITSIPWQKKKFWNREIVLLADFSPHLSPWFKDYLLVAKKMQQWFRERLQVVICLDSEDQQYLFQGKQYDEFPVKGENLHILYLGDLGFLDQQGVSSACYYFLARELCQRQSRIQALLTVHPNDFDSDFQQYVQMFHWDRGQLGAKPARPGQNSNSREQVKQLLAALSLAFEITPALVRKLRLLLDLNVSVESLVLQEGSLIGNSLVFQWQDETVRQNHAARLEKLLPDKQAIWQIIEEFEARLPTELQIEQRQMSGQALSEEQKTVVQRLVRTGQQKKLPDPDQDMVCSWIGRMGQRRAADRQWDSDLANLYYWYWQEKQPAAPLPLALDLNAMPDWIGKPEPDQQVFVRERADQLVFSTSMDRIGNQPLLPGFQANSHCEVLFMSEDGQGKRSRCKNSLPLNDALELPDGLTAIQLITGREQYTIQAMSCPAWATGIGRDQYGLFTEVQVEGVSFILRWMPPGRFMMGSPRDEPERYDDEGPQHEVRFKQGFWLAETACTQELWQAVMGKNPSRFTDDKQNPVEQVSRQDVLNFIKRLNKNIPGLNLRLPSEAEWEYGCRAGTTSPFWFGAELTTEQANYDGNNPYNNGKKGTYRQKTVPVKDFQPNPWGLYQMHGNVRELCQDFWHGNYKDAPDDGTVWKGGDKDRTVARGGSWIRDGRFLRSAYRDDWHFAYDRTGFRLARGPEKQVR